MSRWNLVILSALSFLTLLGISFTYAVPTRDGRLQSKHDNLKLVVDVLEEVQHKYVKDLNEKQMRQLVENMINGGLERLDPHSGYINADEFKQFQHQTKGKFGGVGIRIGIDKAMNFFVESPLPGTPAYNAGVMAGDLILKVDGKSLEGVNLKGVVDLIQGDPGSPVTLSILHEGAKKPIDVTMKRAEIKIDSVMGDQRMKDRLEEWDFWVDPETRIGYVRLVAFTETTTEELTRVVDGLQKAGMRGLVVDLRTNPGGLLRAAVEVSSLFLPEGKNIVSTKGRGNVVEDVYTSRQRNPNVRPGGSYPVAILINRYSASASEIVAAALQDHLRAVVIGERSYGKGSVQNVIGMESGASALKLTTASYWRPSGRNIHRFPDSKEEDEWGVKPTAGFEVKLTDEERIQYYRWRRDRDIVRRAGQEVPKQIQEEDKEEDKGVKEDGAKKEPFRDRVLDKALEYIRGELNKNQNTQAPNTTPLAPAVATTTEHGDATVQRAELEGVAERARESIASDRPRSNRVAAR